MARASAQNFEQMRHCENGVKYWLASELGPFLGYAAWQELPIARAMKACENSRQNPDAHFEQIVKTVPLRSGDKHEIKDFRLSRYACYLLVQNGDPSKPAVAEGQSYLALQTRRQELASSSMGVTERAALSFCATQAEETDRAYHEVARKVDQTIAELGGSVPKGLSPRGIGEQE
ncbi:hypothetical protein B5F76_12835 [Desulfovibrio sp. An276]|nr:hypothetical protein B5F76_12835 [Desulfovibrio sp. An276]